MKQTFFNICAPVVACMRYVTIVVFCLWCVACGKKEQSSSLDKDVEKLNWEEYDDKSKDEILRMERIHETGSSTYNTHVYSYEIERVADDSLGVVTNPEGYRAVDNKITLTVKCDDALVYSKTFTRRAFRQGISDEDLNHYILKDMFFDKMTTSGPRFQVKVGDSDDDEYYVLYSLTVGTDGSINIERSGDWDEEDIDRFEGEELP